MPEFYQHSGRSMRFGNSLTFIGGLVIAIITGFLYAVVTNYIPYIKLRFFATMGFGFGLGGAIGYLAYLTKMRDNITLFLIILFCTVAGYYVAWGTDFHARTGFKEIPKELFFETYRPEVLKNYIVDFYEKGFWTFDNNHGANKNPQPVNGVFLGLIWLVEVVSIFGFSIWAWRMICKRANRVFCEQCQCWMTYSPQIVRRAATKVEELKTALLNGDPMPLVYAPGPRPEDPTLLEVDLYTCPKCSESQYVTLKLTQYIYNKHSGQYDPKSISLVEKMHISADVAQAIRVSPLNFSDSNSTEAIADAEKSY